MYTSALVLLSMFACEQKDNDTSTSNSEDTEETQGTEEVQDSNDESESQDSNGEQEEQENNDTNGDTVPDDVGEEGVNTSENPPTGSCQENTATIQTEDTTYNFSAFYWDFDETEEATRILMTGYQVGPDVDVCATRSFFDYSQINITVTPILSQLPQTVALGVNDYHQNVSGTMIFVEDVNTRVMYSSLEGETTLNSFLEGEKSKISELNVGSLGYDSSGGGMSSFEEMNYQFFGGLNLVGCWCPGMVEAYDNGPE